MGSSGSRPSTSPTNKPTSDGVHTPQTAYEREARERENLSSSSFPPGDICLSSDQDHLLILGGDFLRQYGRTERRQVAGSPSSSFFSQRDTQQHSNPDSLSSLSHHDIGQEHEGSFDDGGEKKKSFIFLPSPSSFNQYREMKFPPPQEGEGKRRRAEESYFSRRSSVYTPEASSLSSSSSLPSDRNLVSRSLSSSDYDLDRVSRSLQEKNAFLSTLKSHLTSSLIEEIASLKETLKSCPLTAAAVSGVYTLANQTLRQNPDKKTTEEKSIRKTHQSSESSHLSSSSFPFSLTSSFLSLGPSSCYEEQLQVLKCYHLHGERTTSSLSEEEKERKEDEKYQKKMEGGNLLKCRDFISDLRQCSDRNLAKKKTTLD